MGIIRIALCVLLATSVWIVGCATQPRPDPLAGWKVLLSRDSEKLSPVLKDDYRVYIQKQLVPKKYFIDENDIWFYEDGNGQRAVRIDIPVNGTYWEHVLVYDKDNKRIKVLIYSGGKYRS
jgi:hypothetical protein